MSSLDTSVQEYLNIEIVNLFLRTSESVSEAKLKLEKLGRRVGEKITEVFVFFKKKKIIIIFVVYYFFRLFASYPPSRYEPTRAGVSEFIMNAFWNKVFNSNCKSLSDMKVYFLFTNLFF